MGVLLFERTKRNVKLTDAGAYYREQWLRLMQDIERVHRQAKSLHDGAVGTMRIGYSGSIAHSFLPELITAMSQSLPEVR